MYLIFAKNDTKGNVKKVIHVDHKWNELNCNGVVSWNCQKTLIIGNCSRFRKYDLNSRFNWL